MKDLSALKELLRRSPLLFGGLFLFTELSQQFYINLSHAAQIQGTDTVKLMVALGQLLVSLIEFLVLAMLVPQRIMEMDLNLPATPFMDFFKKHIGPLTIEGIRALAVCLMWTLLLILPGIYKYIRLFFVPYVVIADPAYQTGQRDALAYSNDIVAGNTLMVFVMTLLLTALDYARGFSREFFPLDQNPLLALIFSISFYFATLYVNVLVFRYYQHLVRKFEEKKPHGTHV